MLSIFAAFVLDCLAGDPYWFPHPVRLIGKYISFFEQLARKVFKSETGLMFAGMLLTFSTVTLAYIVPWMLLKLAYRSNMLLYHAINIVLLYTCLAARCLANEGKKICNALKAGDIQNSRKLLSFIVGRDTEKLDEGGITRGAVETVAENTSDGVIAPLFYMFIGGAPLAMAYKAANTLDSMVGYKNEKYIYFGRASARLDDVLNYIPARLSALFIVFASALLGLNYKNSFYTVKRDGRNHSSPNSGYPEAAVAGALEVQLGGTNSYFGKLVEKPTIGSLIKPLDRYDIEAAVGLMYAASICAIMVFSMINFLWEIVI